MPGLNTEGDFNCLFHIVMVGQFYGMSSGIFLSEGVRVASKTCLSCLLQTLNPTAVSTVLPFPSSLNPI